MQAITVKRWKQRDKHVWVVRFHEFGRVRHTRFKTKDDAMAEASRLAAEVHRTGQVWNGMTAAERESAIALWRQSQNGSATVTGPSLERAAQEMIDAKTTAGRADDYTASLRIILAQFAKGRETMPVSKITAAEVKAYLDSKALASRSTLRARLSTLFKYCKRKKYRTDNPCEELEPITAPVSPIEIFAIDEVESCLAFLRGEHKHKKHSRLVNYRYALPWFVLTTFCGLRPEEAEKTRRKDIHIKEGWIKVEAQTTKVRQRRVVYPMPEAMRLLSSVLRRGRLPLHPQARRRVLKRLRQHLHWKAWPKDITRHTAASNWLASCESADAVSKSLGNSVDVLLRNYAALVTRAEARRFWKVCELPKLRTRPSAISSLARR